MNGTCSKHGLPVIDSSGKCRLCYGISGYEMVKIQKTGKERIIELLESIDTRLARLENRLGD